MDTAWRTFAELAMVKGAELGARTALRHRAGEGWSDRAGESWSEVSYAELSARVESRALGLIALGIEPGDRVCILSETRPEWMEAHLAIASVGAVTVTIYPTSSPDECAWVAGDSGARAVVCENVEQAGKIAAVRDRLPALEHVLRVDAIPPGTGAELAELERRRAAVRPDDPYVFIYTSGTTGRPKGCILSHANCAEVTKVVQHLGLVSLDEVVYLYLPLAHLFALAVALTTLDGGGTLVYSGGDPKRIPIELGEVRPRILPSVPRLFEKIHAVALARVEQGSDEERQRFAKAVELGVQVRELERRGAPVPPDLKASFDAAEERLYGLVRGLFGGRLRLAITGAAPIAPEILRFFYACGITVVEGWGMTESGAVGTVNTPDELRFGSVGKPLPGIELRVADDGELLLRGPSVFSGYWNNERATRETIDADGWLHTGDLGEIDEDGFVRISGRKKDIIITAGGKNITPSNLENELTASRFISRAVMHGDRRPYPVALITLDEEEIVPWAREQGLPVTLAELAGHERIRALVQGELDRVNANYSRVQQIKRFTILDRDLSEADGELTPTLKVKRNVVNQRYADLFDALYDAPAAAS